MSSKKVRAWFVDKTKRLGIIEKGTSVVTQDGHTSDWTSITEVKPLKLYTISLDADLDTSDLTNTWTMIPLQFHEALVFKAIAGGYKDPRNMDFDVAQYFDREYEKSLKEAKKFAKSNYQTVGVVSSQDF
mgnify:FL=1